MQVNVGNVRRSEPEVFEPARLAGRNIAPNATSLTAGELVYVVHLPRVTGSVPDKPEKSLNGTGG